MTKDATTIPAKLRFVMGTALLLSAVFCMPNAKANQLDKQTTALHGKHWQFFSGLEHAGFILLDESKQTLESKNPQQAYVPASTTKLITALLALQHWGPQYRFQTEFFIKKDKNNQAWLVVKGYGDPFLVSEELKLISEELKPRLADSGIEQLAGIQLDVGYYQPGLIMPGTAQSDNPYDAIPSALAANFNTIYVKKNGADLVSAEQQTPMTKTGLAVANTIGKFKKNKLGLTQRVNLGSDVILNQRYFAELLAAFLKQQQIEVGSTVVWQNVAQNNAAGLVYRHYNSRTLSDVIKPMMKYSTNFIANQIALNLSVDVLGGQATQAKVRQTYHQLLTERFQWQDFQIEDGAGLSRNNSLTPTQLIDVLHAFEPWVQLLPEIEQGVFAKSGSLIGVSTLAGYVKQDEQMLPFAMMINQKVPYRFRNKLARELSQAY